MKSRKPLWLPYILDEQNSIDITTNEVKSLCNPIRTKTVYMQHCTGTQMAWHTYTIAALEANNTVLTVYGVTAIVLKLIILQYQEGVLLYIY